MQELRRTQFVLFKKLVTFFGEVSHFSSIDVLFPLGHGLFCQTFLTRAPTVMLHHLQGLVAGDTLDLLRGTASLIQSRSGILSQAVELNRTKVETGLVPSLDGIETTLRQRLTVASADNRVAVNRSVAWAFKPFI